MEFSIFVNIAIAAGFTAFTVLCIYLIFVLVKIRQTVVKVNDDIDEISKHAVPLCENLKVLSEKARNISESVDDQVDILRSSVESIRDMTENIVSFERKLQSEIEGPVMEGVSFIAAVVKAVKAFMNKLRE